MPIVNFYECIVKNIYHEQNDHNVFKQVVRKWLNYLPLKHDFNEARYAHGLLVKLIQR
jgi:hypothetical protein